MDGAKRPQLCCGGLDRPTAGIGLGSTGNAPRRVTIANTTIGERTLGLPRATVLGAHLGAPSLCMISAS
jgi:hypothetical protein